MFVNKLKLAGSFVRWRLKPVRWSGKLLGQLTQITNQAPANPEWFKEITVASAELEAKGYTKITTELSLPLIDVTRLEGKASGKSFVDIGPEFPVILEEAFVQIMKLPGLQETVLNYFKGRPHLWNVAMNYSDMSDRVSDSQFWHFDYGDTKQLHFMAYFSEVGLDCGPFTFLDASTSSKVTRHPLVIERLTDGDLARYHDIDVHQQSIRLVGSKGDLFAADSGRVLHQGARCAKPRLVMFITFTTPTPMSRGGRATMPDSLRMGLWNALIRSGPNLLDKRVFV